MRTPTQTVCQYLSKLYFDIYQICYMVNYCALLCMKKHDEKLCKVIQWLIYGTYLCVINGRIQARFIS